MFLYFPDLDFIAARRLAENPLSELLNEREVFASLSRPVPVLYYTFSLFDLESRFVAFCPSVCSCFVLTSHRIEARLERI
jgi:hypothetical protein